MTWQEITDFTKKYIPCSIIHSGTNIIDLPSELCYYSIIRCEFDGIRIAYNFKILNNLRRTCCYRCGWLLLCNLEFI